MKILVIEDDRTIGKSLLKGFQEAGYDCEWAINGRTGLEKAAAQQSDVIVLDLMLPELGGLEVLLQLRANGIQTPVVVLTAKGTVQERVEGLEGGADDYLVKPFAFAELKARVEAVTRRSSHRPSASLESGDVSLDLTSHRVSVGAGRGRAYPDRIQHSGIAVATRWSSRHAEDAVRACVGIRMGRTHQCHRSPHYATSTQN